MKRILDRPGRWALLGGMLSVSLATVPTAPARAAEVREEDLVNGTALISIIGEIKQGDEEKFRELSIKNPRAIVALESPGGLIIPALEIGRMINLRGYSTVVLDKTICASACSLIWLGGIPRYLEPGGILGFHASYKNVDGKLIESGAANALIGHYLSQLNLPERAALFAAAAPPDKLLVLNEENRLASGIQFETIRLEEAGTGDFIVSKGAPQAAGPGQKTPCGTIASGICLPALTRLSVRIESPLSSRTAQSGEVFRITLAQPIVVDGKIVVPAGAKGQGEVIHAKDTGFGARGELLITARFLEVGGKRMALRSMRVGGDVKDPNIPPIARDLATGLPVGFVRGEHIEIPAGAIASAKTAAPFVVAAPAAQPAAPTPAPPATDKPQ